MRGFFITFDSMIAVLDIWNRLAAYSQKYQSGADNVAYFNTALAEVQLEIYNDFSPLYDENQKIKNLLDVWVKEEAGTSFSTGFIRPGTPPEIINRPISIGYTSINGSIIFSIIEIDEDELVAVSRIPQRAPNVAKKNVYFRFNSPYDLQFYPKTTIPYDLFYMIYPTPANIAFTFSTTADEDIMTYDPANSVDLLWPGNAFNLILYKMLEKYGVSVREELLQAYSQVGFKQQETDGEGGK